jgi:hypothetical protein
MHTATTSALIAASVALLLKYMKRPTNLLSQVLAFLAACAFSPAALMGADDPPALKPAVTDTAPANSASKPPMVTHNHDGTFTVRKEPSKGTATDGKFEKGLVIPAQVVVPITLTPEKPV